MKPMQLLVFFTVSCIHLTEVAPFVAYKPTLETYQSITNWVEHFTRLPLMDYATKKSDHQRIQQIYTDESEPFFNKHFIEEFKTVSSELRTSILAELSHQALWHKNRRPPKLRTQKHGSQKKVEECYVQKIQIQLGSTLALIGDLHGGGHELLHILSTLKQRGELDDNFTIRRDNFYLIFLGDSVDRGYYGLETLYLLLRLKQQNPHHMFFIRGNHEDTNMNTAKKLFTLDNELSLKTTMSNKNEIFNVLKETYFSLPVALYIGFETDDKKQAFIQCCHGGLELGCNPKGFLRNPYATFRYIDRIKRKRNYEKMKHAYFGDVLGNALDKHIKTNLASAKKASLFFESFFKNFTPRKPSHIGFMWSDFLPFLPPEEHEEWLTARGRTAYGKMMAHYVLAQQGISGVFRGHQHSGLMREKLNITKGFLPLYNFEWANDNTVTLKNGFVCTILSGTQFLRALGRESDFEACFLTIETNGSIENWHIEHSFAQPSSPDAT